MSHDPCEACRARFAQGITLFEATDHRGKPEFTGRYLVVTEEAVDRIFQPATLVEQVLRARKAFVEPAAFALLAPPE